MFSVWTSHSRLFRYIHRFRTCTLRQWPVVANEDDDGRRRMDFTYLNAHRSLEINVTSLFINFLSAFHFLSCLCVSNRAHTCRPLCVPASMCDGKTFIGFFFCLTNLGWWWSLCASEPICLRRYRRFHRLHFTYFDQKVYSGFVFLRLLRMYRHQIIVLREPSMFLGNTFDPNYSFFHLLASTPVSLSEVVFFHFAAWSFVVARSFQHFFAVSS